MNITNWMRRLIKTCSSTLGRFRSGITTWLTISHSSRLGTDEPTTGSKDAVEPRLNRKLRRQVAAYERARKKHDVWVEPKGEKPRKREARSVTPPRKIAEPEGEPRDMQAVGYLDEHHTTIGGPDVLYRNSEFVGEYNFRDTILEQLESYFFYLRRMRNRDPGTYDFYRQFGAHVVPYIRIGVDHPTRMIERGKTPWGPHRYEIPPFFHKHRPGFGCFAFGVSPVIEGFERKSEDVIPRFMYFTKYDVPPCEMQHVAGKGDYYKMTVWWDERDKKGVPSEYGVFVFTDRSVQVLRTLDTKHVKVPTKRNKRSEGFFFNLPQRAWRYPSFFKEWAKHHNSKVTDFLAELFCMCAIHLETAQYSMVRVAVTKKDITAVFGVNIERMGYFFKDRDYELTEGGHRKPIFHMVRPHRRVRKDGTEYWMPWSFRGQNKFTWAGYDVAISVPGKDHPTEYEVDIGSTDSWWVSKKEEKDYLGQKELGAELAREFKP